MTTQATPNNRHYGSRPGIERLILFDIDGTLLRTEGAGRASTRDAMLEVFGTASTIDSHHFGGKTDWFTLATLLADHGHTEETVGAQMEAFIAAMGRHMAVHIRTSPARPLPGALQAVDRLRADPAVLLGIVTGNAPSSAQIKLESAGFHMEWFPVSAFGTESVNRNDLPRLALERAQAYSGVHLAPEQVTVIGDTVMDVEAARANAMRVIAVRTGFEDQMLLTDAQPDHLLDDLSSLFSVL
ncbi:MAG: HAD family hydrolase [Chloroflexota bacterium]